VEVAVHPECAGRRQRIVEPAHFAGLSQIRPATRSAPPLEGPPAAALLRPLHEYEQLVGGGW
jgi:hypothetical protein